MAASFQVIGFEGLPEVQAGDDPVTLLVAAAGRMDVTLASDDVLVFAQKIISKIEGRTVELNDVDPSEFARHIASETGKDARVIELVLRESRRIVRMDHGVLITETHHGFVCANAGVDQSNISGDRVTLLPIDADASAARIRLQVKERLGLDIGVIISDTFGRPWREGLTEVAVGVAGLNPLVDYRGQVDRGGYSLRATVIAIADEMAAAAGLIFGKVEGIPVALIRGFRLAYEGGSAKMLVRCSTRDLFR